MPLLPSTLREQFGELGLDGAQVATLIGEPVVADIIRMVIEQHDTNTAKTIALWCLGDSMKAIADGAYTWHDVQEVLPMLVTLSAMVHDNQVSSTAAKEILADVIVSKIDPEKLAKQKDLLQVSDEGELVMIIEKVLAANQKAAQDVRAGEMKAIGYLVGQVMKESAGKANPGVVQQLIKKQLGV